MKWIKHYADCTHSDFLSGLINDLGYEGYGRYWALLELFATKIEEEHVLTKHVKFNVPSEVIRRLVRIRSWTELDSFADRIATERGLKMKRIGNVFEIEAPILLDLLHSDFKKSRRDPERIPPKNKNKELELRNKNNTIAHFDFELIYEQYPRKEGKSKGMKICKAQIKSEREFSDLKLAIENYSKHVEGRDKKYIKQFSSFMSEWRDWVDFKPETSELKGYEALKAVVEESENE